jgi:hypothetical protein
MCQLIFLLLASIVPLLACCGGAEGNRSAGYGFPLAGLPTDTLTPFDPDCFCWLRLAWLGGRRGCRGLQCCSSHRRGVGSSFSPALTTDGGSGISISVFANETMADLGKGAPG